MLQLLDYAVVVSSPTVDSCRSEAERPSSTAAAASSGAASGSGGPSGEPEDRSVSLVEVRFVCACQAGCTCNHTVDPSAGVTWPPPPASPYFTLAAANVVQISVSSDTALKKKCSSSLLRLSTKPALQPAIVEAGAVEALCNMFQSDDPDVRMDCVEAICNLIRVCCGCYLCLFQLMPS